MDQAWLWLSEGGQELISEIKPEIPELERRGYVRETHHSKIFPTSLGRVSSFSLNVRWNCHASTRLDSASAVVYTSMSTGSVRRGFAVRTYLRMRGVGFGARERAWMILET